MKKAVLTLFLLASILPELLTGSSPISSFLNPTHLIILFIGYGLAVVLFREISVRNNLSLVGTYIFGIAFGIFNEGFLAKTLIKSTSLPISQYNDFGYLLGVSFPFTFVISFWHALAAVLTPILIVYYLYPEHANSPWLGKKLTAILSAILIFLGSLSLLGESIIKGNPVQLAVLLILMLCMFLVAKRFKNRNGEVISFSGLYGLKPVWLGMSLFFTYFLLLILLSGLKIPVIIFLLVFAAIIYGYYKILKRNNWLTPKGMMLFGFGNYIQNTILGSLLAFTVPATLLERLLTGLIAIALMYWFVKRVARS